ncbi:MAG: alpha/beta hydrolase [Atribacterota bacterium]|nr:alpha/beta hydrolase [Atribacterota bacterium]
MEKHVDKKRINNDIVCTDSTQDGLQLKMRHYRPETGDIAPNPVILCHGVLSNRYSLDFGDKDDDLRYWNDYSLAAFLFNGGPNGNGVKFDVWVPELRGRRSLRHLECENLPDTPAEYNWCVDHYIDYDVPAFVHRVLKNYRPGTKALWVGMSMGGMLAYAFGETQQGFDSLQGVVTIGSPVAYQYNQSILYEISSRILAPRQVSTMFNLKEVMERFPTIKDNMRKYGINQENFEPDVITTYLEVGFDNYLATKILSHFAVFFRHNNFCRYPRCPWVHDVLGKIPILKKCCASYSYKNNLYRFKTPLLALAGGADREAPPREVKYVVGKVGSRDIQYCEFSKENSSLTDIDYAHLDFHKGKRAKTEVYPLIYEWLLNHCGITHPEF